MDEPPTTSLPPVQDLVTPVPVYRPMLGQLAGVACGDGPSGRDATATDWINEMGWPHAGVELRRGTRVWAYRNVAGQTVGFASLRVDWWMLGRPRQRVAVNYIPMLAVFAAHQERPDPSSGTPKYCYQMLGHLFAEAAASPVGSPLVGLSVRSDNAEAIHVYERVGFTFIPQPGGLNRMLIRLAGPAPS
jgi:hypothetical protein